MALVRKVGILNFHYSTHNYGAVLQAVALEHFLRENGIDAVHIDYISQPENQVNNFTRKLKYFLKKTCLLDVIKKILGREVHLTHDVKNSAVFEEFRNNWLSRTECFTRYEVLNCSEMNFQAVIVGSDQVWRPKQFTRFSDYKVYFLGFLPSKIRKISYAASFGVDTWEVKDNKITDEIKKYIHDFDAVSVREDTGVKICSTVFNVKATHVLDPTLLMGREFFEKIIRNEVKSNNVSNAIVYYKLDINDKFLEAVQKLGQQQLKEVKNIYYKSKNKKYEYYSVPEWLSNIKDSDFVITDSFHCICFCILFEKEFLCCVNASRGLSRLQSLLGMVGLTERICSSEEEFISKINSLKPINYEEVNNLLNNSRVESKKFLLSNLF